MNTYSDFRDWACDVYGDDVFPGTFLQCRRLADEYARLYGLPRSWVDGFFPEEDAA